MKFIFVIQWLRSGGAEKQLLLLSRYLSEKGNCCVIITLGRASSSERLCRLIQKAAASGVVILEPKRFISFSILQLFELARHLRGKRSCILWSWGFRADLICKSFSLFKKVLLICSLRNSNYKHLYKCRWLIRFAQKRVNLFISNSNNACNLLEKITPGVRNRCRVLHNAFDSSEINLSPIKSPAQIIPLRVMMLGNLRIHQKGYDYVARLAKEIKLKQVPARIFIAGKDYELKTLQSLIERYKIEGILNYVGEKDDPYTFLQQGNVFLLMSRYEGLPNSLIEAMYLGMPCIANRVGDLESIASDKINIRLVDIGDIKRVLQILQEFVEDWPSAKTLGMAGADLCNSKFNPRIVTENMILIIEEALNVRLS